MNIERLRHDRFHTFFKEKHRPHGKTIMQHNKLLLKRASSDLHVEAKVSGPDEHQHKVDVIEQCLQPSPAILLKLPQRFVEMRATELPSNAERKRARS